LAALVPSGHRFLANQANALWLADLPEAAHRCITAVQEALLLIDVQRMLG
jgi:hypothetical protein